MNVLDAAIYSKLSGDSGSGGVAALATGGIFQLKARQGTTPPYVVFQELSDHPGYTFGNTVAFDYVPYQIKAFAVDDVNVVSGAASGPAKAGAILDRLRTLLTNPSMTITGKTLLCARLLVTTPPMEELDDTNNRWIYSRGGIFDIWLS